MPQTHKLGFGHGSVIENDDGTISYRQTGKIVAAFVVAVADVTGFSQRKPTKQDRKNLDADRLQRVFIVQGSGTTLAECAVNAGTPEKIEEIIRNHPDFVQVAGGSSDVEGSLSVADELVKLAALRDQGVLSDDEFAEQKKRLLS